MLFDISGGELIVILLFALLFFGSKGIPDLPGPWAGPCVRCGTRVMRSNARYSEGPTEVTRTVNEQRRAFQQEWPLPRPKQSTIPPPPGKDPT
ncbi:MAG: twin-arginine translocase TatA/TatE family subunit [Flavobacteriales bacterium]|nr:twin-arginine translocase TatA/TatE family subunit [Flavobacteriales bacterium]